MEKRIIQNLDLYSLEQRLSILFYLDKLNLFNGYKVYDLIVDWYNQTENPLLLDLISSFDTFSDEIGYVLKKSLLEDHDSRKLIVCFIKDLTLPFDEYLKIYSDLFEVTTPHNYDDAGRDDMSTIYSLLIMCYDQYNFDVKGHKYMPLDESSLRELLNEVCL